MASRSWKNTVYTKERKVGDNAKQGHQPVFSETVAFLLFLFYCHSLANALSLIFENFNLF